MVLPPKTPKKWGGTKIPEKKCQNLTFFDPISSTISMETGVPPFLGGIGVFFAKKVPKNASKLHFFDVFWRFLGGKKHQNQAPVS